MVVQIQCTTNKQKTDMATKTTRAANAQRRATKAQKRKANAKKLKRKRRLKMQRHH